MHLRRILWMAAGLLALGVAAFAVWLYSLPEPVVAQAASPVTQAETRSTLAALQPPHRKRPLIAIVGGNLGTQTRTADYLLPHGILAGADVADVIALATAMTSVRMYPALRVLPQGTVARFDQDYPTGADYVIVPGMSRNDPQVVSWLRQQGNKGAIVIGVGAGAKLVAAAGLLDGKRATTHWEHVAELRDAHPTLRYVADRRFVVDGRMVTTTGIPGTIATMLTLVEAIAGNARATRVARELGVEHWDARRVGAAFAFSRPIALTTIRNALRRDEGVGIELQAGADEVTLGLLIEAWADTGRAQIVSYVAAAGTVHTRGGLDIIPDAVPGEAVPTVRIMHSGGANPTQALHKTMLAIEARYGADTADLVANRLEYPR